MVCEKKFFFFLVFQIWVMAWKRITKKKCIAGAMLTCLTTCPYVRPSVRPYVGPSVCPYSYFSINHSIFFFLPYMHALKCIDFMFIILFALNICAWSLHFSNNKSVLHVYVQLCLQYLYPNKFDLGQNYCIACELYVNLIWRTEPFP